MTRKIAYITLGVLLVAALAFPQAGTGRLEGVVRDSQGLVLPGATVTIDGLWSDGSAHGDHGR